MTKWSIKKSIDTVLVIVSSHPLYFLASLAFFISTIGTAFTSVAVYYLLEKYTANTVVFAFVFAAGTAPGFITSLWAGRVVHRKNLFYSVFSCQIIATFALIIPLIGMTLHRVDFLIAAEAIASATTGLLLPFIKRLEKTIFKDEHLEFLAAYDTYFFTFSFVFGQGLATILLGFMSPFIFLLVDLMTYLASCILLYFLRYSFKSLFINQKTKTDTMTSFQITSLNKSQQNVLLTFLWLSLTCSAPMALLPSIGKYFLVTNTFPISPTLMLLCSRTIGQILAPVIATWLGIAKMSRSLGLLVTMLICYLLAYTGAFVNNSLILSCTLVILAHFCSNIVFTIAQYRLLKEFNSNSIGWAAAFNYRSMTVASVSISLLAGYWIDALGVTSLFTFLFFIMAIGFFTISRPLASLTKVRRFYND